MCDHSWSCAYCVKSSAKRFVLAAPNLGKNRGLARNRVSRYKRDAFAVASPGALKANRLHGKSSVEDVFSGDRIVVDLALASRARRKIGHLMHPTRG